MAEASSRTGVTLDDLAQHDPDELMEMCRSARTPSLEDLDGPVWLGLAYLKRHDGQHLACFFGIANQTDA
jgi:hypothetical protein